MAYESLKQEIRQYIKTNGQNEITGQILQDVLIDMVNQYPSLDGYATQQWVESQNYISEADLANILLYLTLIVCIIYVGKKHIKRLLGE